MVRADLRTLQGLPFGVHRALAEYHRGTPMVGELSYEDIA
jgi:hypothetical protein